MFKDIFIQERTDRRELLFLNSLDKKYILVEGKNDKLFYTYYYETIFKKKENYNMEFKECNGIFLLHKILEEKRIKKGYNNYYAIIDKDSKKFRSTVLDLSVFDSKYTLLTEGYCLENYYFTDHNLPKTLRLLESFLVIGKEEKKNYLSNLYELLKEFLTEFCEGVNFTPIDDYFTRNSIKYISVIKKASVEGIQVIEDCVSKKYYDNIPSSLNEVHGKDLLLAFILLINYLDEKFKNNAVNIFDKKNLILDMPHQLMNNIEGFKIKSLDNFFKRIYKS